MIQSLPRKEALFDLSAHMFRIVAARTQCGARVARAWLQISREGEIERDRERERERQGETEREREREGQIERGVDKETHTQK